MVSRAGNPAGSVPDETDLSRVASKAAYKRLVTAHESAKRALTILRTAGSEGLMADDVMELRGKVGLLIRGLDEVRAQAADMGYSDDWRGKALDDDD